MNCEIRILSIVSKLQHFQDGRHFSEGLCISANLIMRAVHGVNSHLSIRELKIYQINESGKKFDIIALGIV